MILKGANINLSKWFLGEKRSQSNSQNIEKRYSTSFPSFADEFSILDFSDQENVFLLDDGVSVGSGIEISDIQSEAMSKESLDKIFNKVVDAFSSVVPRHRSDPWVMQIFVNDDYITMPLLNHVEKGIPDATKDDELTKEYVENIKNLLEKMSRKEGLFIDGKTGRPYRTRARRIRILFYRKRTEQNITIKETVAENKKVMTRVMKRLTSVGVYARRLKGRNYYDWFLSLFNPCPKVTKGSVEKILSTNPYPKNKSASFHHIQDAIYSEIETNYSDKYIAFDDEKYRTLFLGSVKSAPEIGVLSKERKQTNDNHVYGLLDIMPEGTIYSMHVVFEHQNNMENHITKIEKAIVGNTFESKVARENIKTAKDQIEAGNSLYWVTQALTIRGETVNQLDEIEEDISEEFLTQAKIRVISSKWDEHPIDSFFKVMPFNYDYVFARKHMRYENVLYASEMAALLPIYGRFKGDVKSSSLLFFNRLGEAINMDILSKKFITYNSHMAIFANSGFGKSVLACYLIFALMATKNARIVIFELGNSFNGLSDLCKEKGKNVKQMLFSKDPSETVPVNPFCDALSAIDEVKNISSDSDSQNVINQYKKATELDIDASEEDKASATPDRFRIGELMVALRTMITQAKEKEEEKFTIADDALLLDILCDAIVYTIKSGDKQMLIEHVFHTFESREEQETNQEKKRRITEFKDRLKIYLAQPALKHQFNQPSEPLGDFDLLHIDVGSLQDDEGTMTMVMLSILPQILSLAESTQNSGRPTFLFLDEAHILLKIRPLCIRTLFLAKCGRKLNIWIVPITQNTSDLSKCDIARRILSLIESWIIGGCPDNKVEQEDLMKFKSLTPDQQKLVESVDSEKGKYSEAVFLGSRHQGMFRIILPRFLLALAMTEANEKSERAKLEKELGKVGAAREMAKKLEAIEVEREIDDEDSFIY